MKSGPADGLAHAHLGAGTPNVPNHSGASLDPAPNERPVQRIVTRGPPGRPGAWHTRVIYCWQARKKATNSMTLSDPSPELLLFPPCRLPACKLFLVPVDASPASPHRAHLQFSTAGHDEWGSTYCCPLCAHPKCPAPCPHSNSGLGSQQLSSSQVVPFKLTMSVVSVFVPRALSLLVVTRVRAPVLRLPP